MQRIGALQLALDSLTSEVDMSGEAEFAVKASLTISRNATDWSKGRRTDWRYMHREDAAAGQTGAASAPSLQRCSRVEDCFIGRSKIADKSPATLA